MVINVTSVNKIESAVGYFSLNYFSQMMPRNSLSASHLSLVLAYYFLSVPLDFIDC